MREKRKQNKMAARQLLDSVDLGVRLSTVSAPSVFYNKELLQFAKNLFIFQLSPKYLHTNSTSHTWPFSAIAELIGKFRVAASPELVSPTVFWPLCNLFMLVLQIMHTIRT